LFLDETITILVIRFDLGLVLQILVSGQQHILTFQLHLNENVYFTI